MSNTNQESETSEALPESAPVEPVAPETSSSDRRLRIGVGIVIVVFLVLVGASQGWFGGGDDEPTDAGTTEQASGDINEAVSLINAGDNEGAQEILNAILATDPKNALANYNLGVIAQFAGDNGTAISYYVLVLEVEPLFQSALYNIGLAYRDVGQTELAISSLETLIANYPNNIAGLYNLGALLIENGDESAGNAFIARAQSLEQESGS